MSAILNELQIYKMVTAMTGDVLYCYNIAEDEMTFYYGNTDKAIFGQGTKHYMQHVEEVYRHGEEHAIVERIFEITWTGTPGFFEFDMHLHTKTGEIQPSHITGRVVYDDDNNPSLLVGRIHEIIERSGHTEPAEEGFHRDSLTGAYDRGSFKHKMIGYMDRKGEDMIRGYLLFSVDDFRMICRGETFVENVVLVNIVQTVKRIFPYNVFIGRVRYDEFGVFYYGRDIESEFLTKIDELDRAVRRITLEELARPVTISGGVYFANVNEVSAYDMRDRARIAQIAAINRGKGRIVPYRPELEDLYNGKVNLEVEYNDTRFDNNLIEQAMTIMTESGNAEESINKLLRKVGIMYNLDRITVCNIEDENESLPVLARWIEVHSHSAVNEPVVLTYDIANNLFSGEEDAYVDRAGGTVICRYTGLFGEKGIIDFKAREKNRDWSEREIRTFRLITKLVSGFLLNMRKYMQLVEQDELAKTHDAVTGFAKYEEFITEATEYIAQNPDKNLAILYTGMKDFLGVNAKYGHEIGDEVLRGYAEELLQTEDRVVMGCRRNADNFVALVNCFDLRGNPISAIMIERMSRAFQDRFAEKCAGIDLAINAGVVFLPKENPGDLHAYVDRALIARDKARADDNTSCIMA